MNYSILSRSYDLRWVYPTEIDEELYFRTGYAIARYTRAKKIMIWHDARLSWPSLYRACIAGIISAGAEGVGIGFCSSDMLAFGTNSYDDIDAGIMITASHNPKDQNGLKASYHGGKPINLKIDGPEIARIAESCDTVYSPESEFQYETRDISDAWVDHVLSFSSTRDFSGLKIVVDGGNGAAWAFLEKLMSKAWIDIVPLFLDPDGNFPNHHPNPMLEKNREHAKQAVLDTGANMAFLFDGDADRVVILDSSGEMVVSGIICSIIADSLLRADPGKTVAGNAVISHTLQDTVRDKWGQYIRTRVDSVAIKAMMLENPDIIFAGEHSTHYFVAKNWSADSGIIAAFIFLDILIQSWKSLEDLIQEYRRYITLEETNFTVLDPRWAIQKLAEIYKLEKYDMFDGITVTYDDGSWWNFRPASNDPVVRLNMEARTQERFDVLYAEIMEHIRTFGESNQG